MNKWHLIGFLLIIVAFVHRPGILRELLPSTTILRRDVLHSAIAQRQPEAAHRLASLFASAIFFVLGVISLLYAWGII